MIASFPNSALLKITSEPHYESLVELRDALKENYSLIPSRRRGGTHGYLGGLQPDSVYAIVAPGTLFVIPPDPGQLIIPSGTNIVTSVNLHFDHAKAEREFKEWINLERAGKINSRRQLAKRFSPECFIVIMDLPISR